MYCMAVQYVALCIHLEMWISTPRGKLFENIGKRLSSQPVRDANAKAATAAAELKSERIASERRPR